jgi:hypothetical protein
MKKLALVLLALLAFPAHAQEAMKNDRPSWNPPARYDRPYDGRLIEYPLPQQAVRRYCVKLGAEYGRDLGGGMHQRGCAVRLDGGKTCIIAYINKRYGLATPEAVRRHEIGHCNGWPANHPD